MDLLTNVLIGALALASLYLVNWLSKPILIKVNQLDPKIRKRIKFGSLMFFVLFIPFGILFPLTITWVTMAAGIIGIIYGIYLRINRR